MEQMTQGEWLQSQLKRAPSFVLASAITAILLLICAVIEYSPAGEPPPTLPPVRADVEQEVTQQFEEIKRNIDPEPSDLEPSDEVFEEPVETVSEVETDIFDEDIDIDDFVEDDSMVTQPTDPVPGEFTALVAVNIPDSGNGRPGSPPFWHRDPNIRPPSMPPGNLDAIHAGLRWLKRNQNTETGGWRAGRGGRDRNVGVSGLALLAFLGYGCTDDPRGELGEFAPTVTKVIEYLIENQEQSHDSERTGWFGGRLYTQGIATMALAEAAEMVRNLYLREKAREAAELGLNYILERQPEHGAFSYTGPGNDISVTGFQLQAIKAAMTAGISIPEENRRRIERLFEISMGADGSTPYRIDPERSVQGRGKLSMTAVLLTGRLWLGQSRRSEACLKQAEYLTRNDQHIDEAKRSNRMYNLYYMSLAMFNMGGRYWREWNHAFHGPLVERQIREEGPDHGSWCPEGDHHATWGGGGRVYTTAMACMTLSVYFRYLPTYQALDRDF